MALKQRRGSIAYRSSLKPQSSDNPISLRKNTLSVSLSATDETSRDGHRSRRLSPIPSEDTHLSSAKRRTPEEAYVNGNISPNNLAMRNSTTTQKSIRTNGETKRGSSANEKSSTTCTIQ
jgi:hypothetical protein